MGLDLFIRTHSNFKIDDKCRDTYTVTQIGNLRNCWQFLEGLQHYYESLGNGMTTYIYGEDFWKALEFVNDKDEKKYIKDFIKENNIDKHDETLYEVHAWW